MIRCIYLLLILFGIETALAQTVILEKQWNSEITPGAELSKLAKLQNLEGHSGTLEIVATQDGPINLFELKGPNVSGPIYALEGFVAYSNVSGKGYFELINDFGDKGSYFTRTLAPAGPMGVLAGSSPWRPLAIPFSVGDKPWKPHSLKLNVILPAGATIQISPLTLVQHHQLAVGQTQSSAIPNTSITTNPYIGTAFGVILGALGILTAVLVLTGKGQTLVLGAWKSVFFLGFACLLGGGTLAALGQSAELQQSLMIYGGLMFGIPLPVMATIRRHCIEAELRRMQAQDSTGDAKSELK